MATNLTVNGFNVGTDASVTIRDQFGDVFSADMLGHLMSLESESEDNTIKVTPITNGGVPVYQTLWNGISGSLMFTRTGPAFNRMVMDLMDAYHTMGIIPQFTISVDIRNRDTSIDSYLYAGVQFSRPKFGTFHGVKEVDMRMGFHAATMSGTGALTSFLAAVVNAA